MKILTVQAMKMASFLTNEINQKPATEFDLAGFFFLKSCFKVKTKTMNFVVSLLKMPMKIYFRLSHPRPIIKSFNCELFPKKLNSII